MIFGDNQYTIDIKNCNNLPSKSSYWCKDKAKDQWLRRLSWMKNIVYPWNNRDWDYKQFVKNKYDPENVLQLKKGGSMQALTHNIDILIKQIESLISAPNPDSNSVAGITDQPVSNNIFKGRFLDLKKKISILSSEPEKNRFQIEGLHAALNEMISSKLITSKEYGLGLIQDGVYQKPPYDDKFFDKTITGESSSSYFIQTGFCKSKEPTKNECISKKFSWEGDPPACYKPKYIYINNSPGLKVGRLQSMKGLVPSIINDISQLNPDSIMGIMNGYSVPGVDIQQCMDEPFDNYKSIKTIKMENGKSKSDFIHKKVIKDNNKTVFNRNQSNQNNKPKYIPKYNPLHLTNNKAHNHIMQNQYNHRPGIYNLSRIYTNSNDIDNINSHNYSKMINLFAVFGVFAVCLFIIFFLLSRNI